METAAADQQQGFEQDCEIYQYGAHCKDNRELLLDFLKCRPRYIWDHKVVFLVGPVRVIGDEKLWHKHDMWR